MLVTVALLVLMMTIIVQIFRRPPARSPRREDLPGARRQPPPARHDDPPGPRRRHRAAHPAARPQATTSATSSTARTRSPTSRARTPTTTSGSPPRPPKASSSPGGLSIDVPPRPAPTSTSLQQAVYLPKSADHDHEPVRRGHLLPPQRQPLPPRPARRPRAADGRSVDFADFTLPAGIFNPSAPASTILDRELAGGERPLGPPDRRLCGHGARHRSSSTRWAT